MKPGEAKELLRINLGELKQARVHLDFSFQQIRGLSCDLTHLTEEELESVEAFCSRFARTVDLLVNKVLRSLDRVELVAQGTLIDVVNRAEKRGFIESAEDLREMKDIRNVIAHDYAGGKAGEILSFCQKQKPRLDAICNRTRDYALTVL